MTIEVRQMVIRSSVGGEAPVQRAEDGSPDRLERLREEVLAECKAWLEDRLRRERER
jgi:hypothetical protein